jgi:hypothetical protein
MPIMRATFFFEDDNKHGWTESWYNFAATSPSNLMPQAKKLAISRISLMGTTSRLKRIRTSDDLVKRDALSFQVSGQDGSSQYYTDMPSASANYAVLCMLSALDPTKRGHVFLSGIPDEFEVDSGKFQPPSIWRQNFVSFRQTLLQDQWAIKNKSGTVPVRNIIGVVQDPATGNVTVTTDVDHGFLQGDGIILRGTGIPQLSGTFTVLAGVTHNTFKVALNVIIGLWPGLGTVTKIDYALYLINDAQFGDGGHRNRGRFTDSPVGRRRARKRR